jgi:hypothetical protein
MNIKRSRAAKGTLVISFTEPEVDLLRMLLDELDELVEVLDGGNQMTKRLFPAGYRDDEVASEDFRDLTQTSLQQERRDRYGQCRAELPFSSEAGGVSAAVAGKLTVTAETSQRWLIAINDMRLALGTRLGVTAAPLEEVESDHPDAGARMAYHWLTSLQDNLLTQLMR